jgi:hypothetical protein
MSQLLQDLTVRYADQFKLSEVLEFGGEYIDIPVHDDFFLAVSGFETFSDESAANLCAPDYHFYKIVVQYVDHRDTPDVDTVRVIDILTKNRTHQQILDTVCAEVNALIERVAQLQEKVA